MKTLRLGVVALALTGMLGVSAAHAQDSRPSLFSSQARAAAKSSLFQPTTNKVDIDQRGRANGAGVGQNGFGNAAQIFQRGAENAGIVNQTGSGNAASVHQLGKGNNASITQQGDNNTACVVQVGKNLSTDVIQEGDGQSRGVVQTKKRTYDIPAQACAMEPSHVGLRALVRIGKGY